MLRVFASRGVFASRAVLATRSAGDVARRGAYKDREATAEKEFALKRDREALEKLRAQLRAEEERVAEEHGPSAVRDDVAEPSVKVLRAVPPDRNDSVCSCFFKRADRSSCPCRVHCSSIISLLLFVSVYSDACSHRVGRRTDRSR